MADESIPPANLILQALHGIRSDLKVVHEDLGQLREQQAETNLRLDQTNLRLDRVEGEMSAFNKEIATLNKRVTTGFIETNTKLAGLTLEVSKLGKKTEEHDRRIDHMLTTGLGAEIRELKKRMTRVEGRAVPRPSLRRK